MKKDTLLNQWLWKWHVIAGLLTLPVMLLLTITGAIYLFKDDVNQYLYKDTLIVTPSNTTKLSLEQQLEIAGSNNTPISGLIVPQTADQATAFRVASKGRAGNYVYVDPYQAEITGSFSQKQSLMFDIRKLHGELLLSKPGTLIVELVASWFIVLILTGVYVWWPKDGFSAKGLFSVRFAKGSRAMWRDLHAVFGFWLSVFLLIIIAGGMPWTDVFGSQLKWVQKQTNTGYPVTWRSSKGLSSDIPPKSQIQSRLTLDQLVRLPEVSALKGKVSIKLPKGPIGVYSVSNQAFYLADQKVLHLDQYSGHIVKQHTWDDVGILMDLRQVFMRLHQGQYGKVNWAILLLVSVLFLLSTIAGLVSYLKRKPTGNWAIPKVPARFQTDKILLALIIALGLLFPLFGLSVLLITGAGQLKKLWWRKPKDLPA